MTRQRGTLLLLGILVEGGLAVLAWVLAWFLDVPMRDSFQWTAAGIAYGALACLPMLAVFLLCVHWPIGPFRGMERFFEETLRPLFAPYHVVDFALISVLAGFGEEMLFRGVLQEAFSHWRLGAAGGLVLASALFGVLHPMTPTYAVVAFVLGLYLGCVFWATDNLVVVAVAHGLYDFMALVYLLRIRRAPHVSPETGRPSGW